MACKKEIMTFYGRCRCCLEYGYMKSMWKEHMWNDEREIYGEMLMETFNISWDSDSSDEHICETCVARLRDAYQFKKEVLSAEHLLQEDFDEDECLYEIDILKEGILSDGEYDMNASVTVKGDDSNDFVSEAGYGEIEFLEEDAELVEQSVNTLDKETDSDSAPKRKWPPKKKRPLRSSYRKYTQNDLKSCIEAIQTRGLSQSEAARIFNIPPNTVKSKMLSLLMKHDDKSNSQETLRTYHTTGHTEIKKHRDNIRTVLTYTNATAIRGQRGIGFQCYFCPKRYPDPADLKNHSFTHKNVAENFKIAIIFNYTVKIDTTGLQCKICNSDIDDLSLEEAMEHLKMHGKTVHTDIKNHILPFKFDTEQLKCVICDETFTYFKLLAAHMSEHYPNYSCKECGKGFVNKHARRTHSYRHIIGEFPCSICEKIFSTQTRKRDHERVVHVLQNKTYKCNYCSEKFVDAVKRSNHEVSLHGVDPPQFCCQYCDKIYESQRSLTAHVKRCHLLLKPHECEYCQKRFFKKSAMQRHLVCHTGEKKFMCMICKKSYAARSALVKHLKTHSENRHETEAKRRTCFDCGLELDQAFMSHECKPQSVEECLYEDGEII